MLCTHLNAMRMLTLAAAIGLLGAAVLTAPPSKAPTETYIVQGASLADIKATVVSAGGEITHELGIINSIGARLTARQTEAIRASGAVWHLYDNRRVETAKKPVRTVDTPSVDAADGVGSIPDESVAETTAGETGHVTGVAAHQLHAEGITGADVTLAVLDTGFFNQNSLSRDTRRKHRLPAQYDAITGTEVYTWEDSDGHGAHMVGIGLNSELSKETREYRGVALDANLIVLRAFGADGAASYADVIRGID